MALKLAHLLTIMPPTWTLGEITLSSILTELWPFFNFEFTWKFAYHLKYFQNVHWHLHLKLCTLVYHHSPFCTQDWVTLLSILTELCLLFDLEFTLKFATSDNFKILSTYRFETRHCTLFHHYNVNLCTGGSRCIKLFFTILCPICYYQSLRKVEHAVPLTALVYDFEQIYNLFQVSC
jgi:hypothetical protein